MPYGVPDGRDASVARESDAVPAEGGVLPIHERVEQIARQKEERVLVLDADEPSETAEAAPAAPK